MTGQTAKVAAHCACGHVAVRQLNQFVSRGELWWDAEFSCDNCGTYLCEQAGQGTTPHDVREALLAAHGPATLRLAEPVPSLVPALKVFREAEAVSLSQARELAEHLSHDGVMGTLSEMELLRIRLRLRGVPVVIDRGRGR